MTRIARTGVVLLIGAWSAVVLAQPQPTATVKSNGNLRPTPSTAQPPIRLLTPPEVVTVLSTTQVNGYYHVRTSQGEEGWIYRNSVQLSGAPAPLPPVCGPGAANCDYLRQDCVAIEKGD